MRFKRIKPDGSEKNTKIINACIYASKEYLDYNNNFNRFYVIDNSMLFAVNCNSHVAYRFIQRADYSNSSNMNKEYIAETVMELLTLNENIFWDILGYKSVWLVKKYKYTYDALCINLDAHDCGGLCVNTIQINTYVQKVNKEKLSVEPDEDIFIYDTTNNSFSINADLRIEKRAKGA